MKSQRYKHEASVSAKKREKDKRYIKGFGAVVVIALVFCAGFVLGNQTRLLASWGFYVGEDGASSAMPSSNSLLAKNSLSSRIGEVEELLAENSIDEYDLDVATQAVVESLFSVVDDAYLQYYTPERYGSYVTENVSEPYSGIGVLFADHNGRAYVTDVFEGSVAYMNGVRQGDFVVAINGDKSHDWSVNEVVNAVSLGDGETVTITWLRTSSLDSDKGEEYTVTLECSVYNETNVSWNMNDSIGIIKVRQITQNAADLVQQAVVELTNQGATSFVLDLRDNPGGYLTQAINIANLFVPSGVLVEIKTVDGSTTRNASGGVITSAPVIILVNNYTAAAAEVLVAAMQDNQRATVVGETTRGKGSVQVMRELSFGGALRYTAALYISPLGHVLNGSGVMPDVSIAGSEDSEEDAQMEYALEAARSLSQG